MSPVQKGSVPKVCIMAIAHGLCGTELLPSFHSNKQKSARFLHPFFIRDNVSLFVWKESSPREKVAFLFFFSRKDIK